MTCNCAGVDDDLNIIIWVVLHLTSAETQSVRVNSTQCAFHITSAVSWVQRPPQPALERRRNFKWLWAFVRWAYVRESNSLSNVLGASALDPLEAYRAARSLLLPHSPSHFHSHAYIAVRISRTAWLDSRSVGVMQAAIMNTSLQLRCPSNYACVAAADAMLDGCRTERRSPEGRRCVAGCSSLLLSRRTTRDVNPSPWMLWPWHKSPGHPPRYRLDGFLNKLPPVIIKVHFAMG